MPRGSQAFAIFVAGVLLLSPGLAAATTGHHPQLKIGVPLDTPSPSAWSAVIANAPTVGLVVFNPASGPGKAPDLVSASEVSDARETGIKVVGYVYTHYADGNVTLKQAESQVDDYLRWYQVDGIFFDQTNSSCTGSAIGYYSSLYEYV